MENVVGTFDLKTELKNKHFTVREFERLIHVKPRFLDRYVQGTRYLYDAPFWVAVRISVALGISLSDMTAMSTTDGDKKEDF